MKILKKYTLYIYCDGSSYPSPRLGGIGVRYVYLDESEIEKNIDFDENGFKGASNNQMELYACIFGLLHLPDVNIPVLYNKIEIRTDSQYVVNNYKRALFQWPKQKWANSNGGPILNVELWKQLTKQLKKTRPKVEIIWIKGHKDDIHNREVDKMAKKSAKTAINSPLKPVHVRRKLTSETTKIGSVNMKGQKIDIRIISSEFLRHHKITRYRYEVIQTDSEYFGKVDFICSHLFLGDGHSYRVVLNNNQNNPRILKLINEINNLKNPSGHYIRALAGI